MHSFADVSKVDGPNLSLRLIEAADADYVYGLRTNKDYNSHISAIQGTVTDQISWIKRYKTREAQLSELYYIIERRDGTRCGTLRLYNIKAPTFEWGSWILDHNKPGKAALESAVLVYCISFDILKLEKACFDVRRDNSGTLKFHRRFGAVETHSNDTDIFFYYPKSQFESDRKAYWSLLESVASLSA